MAPGLFKNIVITTSVLLFAGGLASCDDIRRLFGSEETSGNEASTSNHDYSIYLKGARKLASKGDYEKAQISYDIYRELSHKQDSEMERILSSRKVRPDNRQDSLAKAQIEKANPYGSFSSRDDVIEFVRAYYRGMEQLNLSRFFPATIDRFYDRYNVPRQEALKEVYGSTAIKPPTYKFDWSTLDARPMASGDLRITYTVECTSENDSQKERSLVTTEMIVNSLREIRSIYVTKKDKLSDP